MIAPGFSAGAARPSLGYWVTLFLTPVVFLVCAALVDHPPRIDPALFHDHAQLLASAAETPPPAGAPCSQEIATLPYLDEADHVGLRSAWFCFDFEPATAAGAGEALFLIGAYSNLSVYLNGWFVGQTAPMVRPLENHGEPLYFSLPDAALKPGRNVLQIHTANEMGYVNQPEVYIGDARLLRPAYERAHLIRVSVINVTLATMVVLVLFMAGMYALRPDDTVYAWFAASIGAWALHIYAHHSTQTLFFAPPTWVAISAVSLGWFVCLGAIFVNRVAGPAATDRWMEPAVLTFGIGVGVLRLALARNYVTAAELHYFVWIPGILAIGLAMVWRLARASLSARNEEARTLLLVAFLVFVVGVRDYVHEVRGGFGYGSVNLLAYTVGAVLTVYTFFLLKRVSRALTEAEGLNRELEQRVASKVREIEAYHEQMLQLEQQQAALRERERITRDMHDGIGGHLIQALSLAEADPAHAAMEGVLRAALGDLRMVIDSTEPVDGDLAAVLAMMRNRCERRIAQAGLRFDWQVGELPPMPNLGPHHVLQILRILEEALTNVIRHAHATIVTVGTSMHIPRDHETGSMTICVDIRDNGRGFGAGADPAQGTRADGSRGRGLRNMQQRAADIGAECQVVSDRAGSRVRLLIPLRRPAAAR